jgi:BirA family biotin operon repressor/biotin-[acetyl-CoA-carboxylase] ligase
VSNIAVKPPNDVLAQGADGRWRKLCGILCEAAGDSTDLHWLAVGIGVNVNNSPELRRATSVIELTGQETALTDALSSLMRRLHSARAAGNFV